MSKGKRLSDALRFLLRLIRASTGLALSAFVVAFPPGFGKASAASSAGHIAHSSAVRVSRQNYQLNENICSAQHTQSVDGLLLCASGDASAVRQPSGEAGHQDRGSSQPKHVFSDPQRFGRNIFGDPRSLLALVLFLGGWKYYGRQRLLGASLIVCGLFCTVWWLSAWAGASKASQYQPFTRTVLNSESREVWRKTGGEKEF